jgi:hypothetical protein
VLSDKTAAAKAEVESTIRKMVDTVSTAMYGRRVDYGRLFSALEMLGWRQERLSALDRVYRRRSQKDRQRRHRGLPGQPDLSA